MDGRGGVELDEWESVEFVGCGCGISQSRGVEVVRRNGAPVGEVGKLLGSRALFLLFTGDAGTDSVFFLCLHALLLSLRFSF